MRIDGGAAPADPGLAADGARQAAALAERWAIHGADAVYASPMRRARETAQPLADALGLTVAVEDGLKEFDADQHFYVPIEELRADEERWKQAVREWLSPAAETERQQFRERVVDTIDAIALRHPDQRVAVVCHGGVINAYLSRLLSLPGTIFFEPAYTSVSRAFVRGHHRQVISLNETPHLPDLPWPATAS